MLQQNVSTELRFVLLVIRRFMTGLWQRYLYSATKARMNARHNAKVSPAWPVARRANSHKLYASTPLTSRVGHKLLWHSFFF